LKPIREKGKYSTSALSHSYIISILLVILDSVASIHEKYFRQLRIAEWVITSIFTVEYITRIYSVRKPLRYILSFYGITDFLAILPGFIAFMFAGGKA
jgi:voltage-gated potassium channel